MTDSLLLQDGSALLEQNGNLLYLEVGVPSLITSYSEANVDSFGALQGTNWAAGEALTLAAPHSITSVKFWIKRVGNPAGNIYAQLFASTGTVGTNATGTGSALAASSNVDVSTISTTASLVEFPITYAASAGDLVLVLAFTGGTVDLSNCIQVGIDASSPTYAGNYTDYSPGWHGYSTIDTAFYLYGY